MVGFLLGCCGVPIYIHLPRFAAAELGISLTVVGGILIGIRILDFAQDPILGKAVDRLNGRGQFIFCLACVGLLIGALWVFAGQLFSPAALDLSLSLVLFLTSFSLATILLYSLGSGLSGDPLRSMSAFRETGIICGVVVGAAFPSFAASIVDEGSGYFAFGAFLALLSLIVAVASHPVFNPRSLGVIQHQERLQLSPNIRSLIALGFVNSLPVR